MNCNACQALLQQTLDGTAPVEGADLDGHLRDCVDCRAYYHTTPRLQSGLRLLRPPTVPTDLTARLVAAIQADRRRIRRARLRLAIGLAAAASVIVAVSVWLLRPNPSPTHTPDRDNNIAKPDREPREAPRVASLTPRQTVEKVVETMASLTVEQTKQLIPPVEPMLPDWSLQTNLPEGTLSLREAGHGVTSAVEPVADHAKRFVGMVRRDLMPDVMPKSGL